MSNDMFKPGFGLLHVRWYIHRACGAVPHTCCAWAQKHHMLATTLVDCPRGRVCNAAVDLSLYEAPLKIQGFSVCIHCTCWCRMAHIRCVSRLHLLQRLPACLATTCRMFSLQSAESEGAVWQQLERKCAKNPAVLAVMCERREAGKQAAPSAAAAAGAAEAACS
jgi:hypothetical protein